METKLYPALLKFRDTVSSVKKDADNPFFKSKYADLPSILEVIKSPLSESKLAITHHCKNVDGNFSMVTTLAHTESGETIESEFPIFGNKPQEIGSSMSYARRYNILALLDIPTEDDDGNTANEAPRTKVATTYARKTDEHWLTLDDYVDNINMEEDIETIKLYFTRWLALCVSDRQKDFFTSVKDKRKKQLGL